MKTLPAARLSFHSRQHDPSGVQGVKRVAPGLYRNLSGAGSSPGRLLPFLVFIKSLIKSPSLVDGNTDAEQMRNVLPSLARSEWEDVFHQEPKIYTVTAVNVPLQRAQRGQASPPHEEINTHPPKKKKPS